MSSIGASCRRHVPSCPNYSNYPARTNESMVLNEAKIPVISNRQCSAMWKRNPDAIIVPSHICGFAPNISVCNGDSGGPMVCEGLLAGVASWTIKGCGTKSPHGTFPSVYVRVSYYIDWIMNTIRANNFV
ncbi:hypothetical protein ACJMK2_031102 [Sinanodonta woodiana]|uniref:Peptidase S1 domain-containing protein n=1 Tax=Sinanodonta woodiana TaxID=1069815 RepID=A0ABD3WZG9_SINWO